MNGANHFVFLNGRRSPLRDGESRLRGVPGLQTSPALLLIIALLPATLHAERYEDQIGKLKPIFHQTGATAEETGCDGTEP